MLRRVIWELRPLVGVAIIAAVLGAAVVIAADSKRVGRIGPGINLQPSGRQLDPQGERTLLGNLPTGGALSHKGRFLWSTSAGQGRNDVRIVRVRGRRAGEVVQKIRMPGLTGGIAMSPARRIAYVSGVSDTSVQRNRVPDVVPGRQGDVIHVLRYDARSGKARRAGLIPVPPPPATLPPQNFPPTTTEPEAWPRDIAVSPDGKTLLAALNLAHQAAIVDLESGSIEEYVATGRYPYGAAITPDGTFGLVSNEADGTVSVINLATANEIAEIRVGPHLSHPEGIAVDPKAPKAYVAVTHQDLIAVIDLETMAVERTLSVERPKGIGTAPVHVSVTDDGCRLLSANSGEDAIAVFSLRSSGTCEDAGGRQARLAAARADRIVQHEARVGLDLAESAAGEAAELFGEEAEEAAEEQLEARPARAAGRRFALIGRIPVGSYPVAALATPGRAKRSKLVWVSAKGRGAGPNGRRRGEDELPRDPGSATGGAPKRFRFHYLPASVRGSAGVIPFPTDRRLDRLTPRASRQIRPTNAEKPPAGTPVRDGGPIEHVFYVVRENRTYDQILGDDPRGDGDPKITLFGDDITPNAHALARRFPLLDHVYANSEASIDGHFWTSAAAVSDYVVKNWHANYAGRDRPYDFGVYSVTWPSQGFLFDQAEEQGISWFNYGEAVAGTVPLTDLDRTPAETADVLGKFAKSDLGPLNPGPQLPPPTPCFSNDASAGGTNVITMQEVFDSSRPDGANPLTTESRFQCFRQRFNQQLGSAAGVPAFNYVVLPNDHTHGTTPGSRTPRAMIAENDLALGQIVDLISHSSIWRKSLILVIEDDSQDGLDHVDAHRIPAFAISPFARRGAVIHTRYNFLSFIRTLELIVGMKPLNLFDALAVPLYDAFDSNPNDNDEPYSAITPDVDLLERNTESTPGAELSKELPLGFTDRTPQRLLDRILWQFVYGAESEPPPPGPNASGLDESRWRQDAVTPEEALEEVRKQLEEALEADDD